MRFFPKIAQYPKYQRDQTKEEGNPMLGFSLLDFPLANQWLMKVKKNLHQIMFGKALLSHKPSVKIVSRFGLKCSLTLFCFLFNVEGWSGAAGEVSRSCDRWDQNLRLKENCDFVPLHDLGLTTEVFEGVNLVNRQTILTRELPVVRFNAL
jgi:hypothetical protein